MAWASKYCGTFSASNRYYGKLIRHPILMFAAAGLELTRARRRATMAGVPTEALDLVGIAIHAVRKEVDKVVDVLKLHGALIAQSLRRFRVRRQQGRNGESRQGDVGRHAEITVVLRKLRMPPCD